MQQNGGLILWLLALIIVALGFVSEPESNTDRNVTTMEKSDYGHFGKARD